MKKRILSLLLALVLLLGVLPTGVLAAADGKLDVTLSGVHDAQVKSLKLFSYADNTKGDEISLGTAADGQYTVELAPGTYWVEGYDAKESCNGGLAITVDESHTAFKIQRIYNISVSPSSWVKDTDYTLTLKITDASGAERKAESGVADNYGKTVPSCIFVLGDTVSATATPNAEKYPNYNAATASKTPTMNDNLSVTCKEVMTLKVTAPAGSTISAGIFSNYNTYSFAAPQTSGTGEGGKVTASYRLDKVPTDSYMKYNHHFVRVQHPDGVTYWTFGQWNDGNDITVTADDLYIGSSEVTKNTIYPNFEKNVYDLGNVYLNINSKGYIDLAQGGSKKLNIIRNWQAIESYMNKEIALPDVHYTVLDANNPSQTSSVVEIVPDANNSGSAVMTAKQEGTAIVLVTYDAMTHTNAQSSTDCKVLSAIWPELTGVFVVSVGKDGSAIKTNMTMNRVISAATPIDAEHDFLYYTGEDGASYSFKPEDGCTVSVLRSTVSATELKYTTSFTTDGIETATDGTVTVSGLTTGRHIIKVTKGDVSTYQVISARQASYVLQNEDGTTLDPTQVKVNSKVKVQFSGLLNPKEKLSGVYNSTPAIILKGEDETQFKGTGVGGFGGAYDFSGTPAKQAVVVTIPKYWTGETYTLSGVISAPQQFGQRTGAHRGVLYGVSGAGSYAGDKIGDNLSLLPTVAIPVAETAFLTGKLVFQDQNSNPIDRKDLTVTLTDAQKNVLSVADDGTFKAYAEEYSYIINGSGVEYKTGSVTLTEDGENIFTITLQTTSDGAWDGKTQTEPFKDAAGTTYLISNGAELAWFVNQSKTADVSGKLTADIDLGKYPWLNISSSKKIVLDGDNHAIGGLNATAGLFAQTGSNSHIQNLTIRGAVSGTGNAGAIVGYASGSGSVIENCVNEAVITSTGNNVGGIVGYAYKATIQNCVNNAAISGASSVGGIIGSFVDNGSIVSGCYNTGAVTATGSKAGGIFGGSSYGITVENCYNTGKITGSTSGGIGGEVKGYVSWNGTVAKLTVSSCYSTGEAATAAVFGTVDKTHVEISKCYYLDTLTKDDNAEALSANNLKDADLSDAFKPVCGGGYPALSWQTDVTFHETTGTGTVTAATCTAKGYTTFTCSKCNASYRTTYTAALGHDFCEDTTGCTNCVLKDSTCTETGTITRTCKRTGCSVTKVDTVPAKGHTPKDGTGETHIGYTTYICAVCGKSYQDWTDDLLSHVSYREVGLSDITVAHNDSYPWVYNTENNRFESSNVDVDKSTSESSLTFTLNFPAILRFSYGVSSESDYDKMTVTLTPDGGSAEKIANAISGTTTGDFSRQLEAGSYTLTFSYTKDDASRGGDDLGYVKGLGFTPLVRVTVENTLYKKSAGAAWEGTLVDTWVPLTGESTIGSCTAAALAEHTVEGIENNYISSIDSLSQMQGASSAGWMITLNDWFIHEGLNNFGFANNYLDAGDEIRIMYTMNGGPDLGGIWDSTDTSLKSLKALGGMLTPKFSGTTTTYTLTLPEGTTSVRLTPTAANKNYQVRAYLGSQADGKEYRRAQPIPVTEGSVITVVCGDPSWPTMNAKSNTPGDSGAADRETPDKHTYKLTVQYGEVKSDDTGVSSVKVANVAAAQTEDGNFTVTLPAGTKVSASSFAITTADSTASVGNPTASGNVWSFTVTAEDGTTKTYTVTVTVRDAKTISVTASMQAENTFMLVPKKLSVSSGLAESYGYEDAVTDDVSALDVLVKVHEVLFGEEFTEETKDAYLSVSSSGWVTKVAGLTDNFSFAVDGEYPCDRSGEYGQYGYTGYLINQAPVSANGSVEFFFYQDSSYMDYYTWFTDASGSRLDAITVTAGESFPLGVNGYMFAFAGAFKGQDRLNNGTLNGSYAREGVQVMKADENGNMTAFAPAVVTDKNGMCAVTFEQAGTYYLSATGDADDELYIVSPWLKVTVMRGTAVRVTVTPDTVSAVVNGSTIRLVGFVNEGEAITVNGQSVKNGDTITINGSTYRIDASGVSVKPVEVTVTEEKPAAKVPENLPEEKQAEVTAVAGKISSSSQTKSEGLAGAASDKLLEDGTKEAAKVTPAEGQKVEVTAKPSLEIEVRDIETTGTQTTLTLDITPKVTYTTTVKDEASGNIVSTTTSEPKTIDNKDLDAPVTISIPLPAGMSTENLYIKHIFSDGSGFEYIKPTIKIVGGETIATWQQSSFSIVMLMADARYATITIGGESTMLTPDLVNKNLPAASKDGMIFTGWTFKIGETDFPGGPYTKLTDELLTALDNARKSGENVTAAPNFKERPSSGSSAKTESPNKPKAEITIDASKFVDVSRSDWFYNAVQYALENGLMNGTSASEFSPNAETTRGMIVTILARGEGVNTNGTPWYGEGQKWAIANGVSDGSNMPGVITREQLATILYRYAKLKGYDTSKSASLKDFPDAGSVSGYALGAMQWAVAEGLITGMSGRLNPQGSATRAQAATILMRFMQNIAK